MFRRILAAAAILISAVACDAAMPKPSEIEPAKINHDALEKIGWKLACQAYTFRDVSAYETVDILSALGIRYVEFYPEQKLKPGGGKNISAMNDAEIEELLKKLRDAKVTAVNYGVVGVGNNESDARKIFEFAKKLGLITIVSEPDENMTPVISRLCEEYKINVAIHDHPKPSRYWNPEAVLKVTKEKDASPRYGACADTGHWYRSGLSPVECLKKLEGRIISFHLKDLDDGKRDVPWGTGKCDVKGMLDEVERQKISPVISIEYESSRDKALVDNVRKCAEYLSAEAERRLAERK
jgi:sugar phosphate isomerase/epimerase